MPSDSVPPATLRKWRKLADISIDDERGEVRCMLDVPGEPGWLVEGLFRLVEGDLLLVAVQMYAYRPTIAKSQAVTARMLRAVPVDALYEKAFQGARAWFPEFRKAGARQAATFAETVADAGRRVGRAGHPDSYYLPWAQRYAAAAAKSRSPIQDLAAEHGMKPAAVRDIIHGARTRGLLTSGRAGVASGVLTDKARSMLAGKQK